MYLELWHFECFFVISSIQKMESWNLFLQWAPTKRKIAIFYFKIINQSVAFAFRLLILIIWFTRTF